MLSRHDAAVRSPLLAARGRLRWRLCDVLECGAVFVTVITRRIAAPILLGIAGQIALKSAANGSATVIAVSQPADDHRPRNLYLRRFQSWSRSPRESLRATQSSPCPRISFGTSPSAGRRWLAL